jgi:chondroitin AC lyase
MMGSSNKLVVAILLFFPLLLTLTTNVPAPNDEFDTIKLRILEQVVWPKPENVSDLVQKVLNISAMLNSSCYWPDLSYTDGLPNFFDTEYHMWRISNMLRAFTVNGSALKNNATILSQVHCALQVWFDHDWINPNWWFNQIGIPLEAGMQLMMLGDNATPTEVANLKNITLRACWWIPNPFYVGANLLWMIQIQIYRCVATRNSTGLQQGFSRMWQDVVMANSSNEGVQYDWAYHFHTRQLLSGSYGNIWLNNVLLFTNCSANTQYEPDEEISNLVANYLVNGDAWMIIDNEWDWQVYGRMVTDPGIAFAHSMNTDWLRSLAGILKSIDLKTRLDDFADRLDSKPEAPTLIGNRAFFASNYQVHRRNNWIATLKIQTGRMYPSECLLGQNLKHEHSGQGVLNIYRRGYNDYIGVFPVLDWQAINGITVEHDIPMVICADAGYYYHNSRPNGGSVSDGQYGASMMDTLSHNLTTQRSWHFYDDAIIALATNLSVNISATPWTTLASRMLPVGKVTIGFFNGTIVTLNDGNYTFPCVENQTTNVQWAHISEQNIGYLLPLQQFYQSFGVEVGYKTGNYAEIDPANLTVTERVVTIFINHGLGPFLDRDYNYMILPNVSLESMPMLIKKYEEEGVFACIFMNSTAPSHGTVWPPLKRATFVTWGNRSTTFLCKTRAYSLNMTIAYGGLYMFSETEEDFTITVANPMRTGGHLNVTVDREGYGQNCAYNSTIGTNVMVYLPTDNVYLGASMNVTCKKQKTWE